MPRLLPTILLPAILLPFLPAAAQAGVPASSSPCATIPPGSDDGPIASPENHTVLFENEDVRVIDVHSRPHTREAVHTHARPAVMYIDRQGAGSYNTPENPAGRSHPTDPNFKPRAFAIKPEGPHWTENTGEIPFHAIRVEFKHPGCRLPGREPPLPPPEDTPPGPHTLLFENDEVRILDLHIAPHTAAIPDTHLQPGFVYIPQLAATPSSIPPSPQSRTIVPMSSGSRTLENTGETPLHLILFQLRFGSDAAASH